MLRRQFSEHEIALVTNSGYFDASWYGDISGQANASPAELAAHYLAIGWLRNLDPSPAFCGNRYLTRHRDVLEGATNPLLHFLTSGKGEGRQWYRHLAEYRPNLTELGPLDITWPEWDPEESATTEVLVVVVDGSIEDLSKTKASLERQSLLSFTVRSLTEGSPEPIETRFLRMVRQHAQISTPFEFVALLQAGDEPSDQWLETLLREHQAEETAALAPQLKFSPSGKTIGGFRLTDQGHLQPIAADKISLNYSTSRPVQYVDIKGAMLRTRLLAQMANDSDVSTWLDMSAVTWLTGRPCFVTNQTFVTRNSTLQADEKIRHFQIIPAERPFLPRFRSFHSFSGLEEGGFHKLRIAGTTANNIPVTPLVVCAFDALETLGFDLKETTPDDYASLAQMTIADVRVMTRYDFEHSFLPIEHGRRTIFLVIENHCTCGSRICQMPGMTYSRVSSASSGNADSYWNFARSIRLSCLTSVAQSGVVSAMKKRSLARPLSEIGLEPIGSSL
jgi:hypothetical protein